MTDSINRSVIQAAILADDSQIAMRVETMKRREDTITVNGSDIDTVEILEYWRMSNAFKVRPYDRLLWTSDRYAKAHPTIPSIRAYKALDRLNPQNLG